MDLHKSIIESKEELYSLAMEYYNNIDKEYLEECLIVPRSMSIVIDHQFIPIPCVEIKLELKHQNEQKYIGHYILYIDEIKNFIDEFLIIN